MTTKNSMCLTTGILLQFAILLISVKQSYCVATCQQVGLVCVNSTHFQECFLVGGIYSLVGFPQSCPTSQICIDSIAGAECKVGIPPPPPPPVTTSSPVVSPVCTSPEKIASSQCNQYYECLFVSWALMSCPSGQLFDIWKQECAPMNLVDCQSRSTSTTTTTTTTTKAPPLPPSPPPPIPKCTGPGKYPAKFCYQYYECSGYSIFWQLELKTCPLGQAYDHMLQSCICAKTIACPVAMSC